MDNPACSIRNVLTVLAFWQRYNHGYCPDFPEPPPGTIKANACDSSRMVKTTLDSNWRVRQSVHFEVWTDRLTPGMALIGADLKAVLMASHLLMVQGIRNQKVHATE